MATVVMECATCGARETAVPRDDRTPPVVAKILTGGCPECLGFGPDRYFDGRGRELDRQTWQPISSWRRLWRDVGDLRLGAMSAASGSGQPGDTPMHIENGILKGDGVRWKKATSSGGALKGPKWIVVHDTAGRCSKYSSVNWFADPTCETSAHFVVERDGTITQMVPTNRRAYHAGVSHWKGVSGLNSCSVGIEIVNPGKMDENGKAWFGQGAEKAQIQKKGTPQHGQGYWLPYTDAQIKSVTAICRALVEEYPDCNEIVTHWEIAPKRKIDTNPLFPLEGLRRTVFDPTPGEVEHLPDPTVAPPPAPKPKEPTYTKELTKSVTGKLTLGTILTIVTDWLFGIGRWVSDALSALVNVLGPAQQEAETTIAPLMSLTKTLQINLGNVAMWMLLGVLGVILFRHLGDKVEKTKLKQQIPEPFTEAETNEQIEASTP